jgi:hypothetical protein
MSHHSTRIFWFILVTVIDNSIPITTRCVELLSHEMSLKRGIAFSYKMSRKDGIEMLGVDHQHGRFGSNEPSRVLKS